MTPLVSIQNPDPEKVKEVSKRGLASFNVMKKTDSQKWGRNGVEKIKVQEFFLNISPPCLGLCFFLLQITEIGKSSLSLPENFQGQGSGYSLRVSSGSLYGVSPVNIPSKCWGWSNLGHSLSLRLWLIPHS